MVGLYPAAKRLSTGFGRNVWVLGQRSVVSSFARLQIAPDPRHNGRAESSSSACGAEGFAQSRSVALRWQSYGYEDGGAFGDAASCFGGNAFSERIIRPSPPKSRTSMRSVLNREVGRKKMCRLIKIPARMITRPAMVSSQPVTDLASKKINPMPMI